MTTDERFKSILTSITILKNLTIFLQLACITYLVIFWWYKGVSPVIIAMGVTWFAYGFFQVAMKVEMLVAALNLHYAHFVKPNQQRAVPTWGPWSTSAFILLPLYGALRLKELCEYYREIVYDQQ